MNLNNKIKYLNPSNFLKKIIIIIQHPSNPILKFLIFSFHKFINYIFVNNNNNKNHFLSIYDLEVNANTYNFAEFIVLSNLELKKRNLSSYKVLIFPRKKNSINSQSEYYSIINDESYQWRIYNILIPLTNASQYCNGFYLPSNRDEGYKILKNYNNNKFPKFFNKTYLQPLNLKDIYNSNNVLTFGSLQAPKKAIIYVKQWLKMKKIESKFVTISIRDQKFDPVRNSNLKEWVKFSNYLVKRKITPIIIPDNDSELNLESLFLNSVVCNEASLNILFRMALVELSFTNMYVSHGPCALSAFNKNSSYIIMNYGPKKNSITDNPKAYKNVNDFSDTNYKFSINNQIRTWKEDLYDNIVLEFDKIT